MILSQRIQSLTASPIRKLSPYADAAKAAGFEVNTSVLQAVEGNGKLSSIRFTDGSTLAVDGLFIALGTADSTDMARKLGAEDRKRKKRIPPQSRRERTKKGVET